MQLLGKLILSQLKHSDCFVVNNLVSSMSARNLPCLKLFITLDVVFKMRSHIRHGELSHNCAEAVFERLQCTSNKTFQQEGNLNTKEMWYRQEKLLLLKHWRSENETMQSVESVTLQQYLNVVMETAKELHAFQKRACELWGFLIIIYCYGWYV